ncbi:hypothetical protein AALP_AAs68319U000300 [Arabis alpina]|uniref:Uncharacterized protein n=1 Tax=Arabis alpina TaxID=50452 RepID=A0A087G2N5_ARAAL|nr:hypothetical protein AALP_AAs68319U000300 [Arabis alpina]
MLTKPISSTKNQTQLIKPISSSTKNQTKLIKTSIATTSHKLNTSLKALQVNMT